MTRTEIIFTGESTSASQELALELLEAGYEVDSLAEDEIDRGPVGEVAGALAVGIVTNGMYDVIKTLVQAWLRRRGLPPDSVEVRDEKA